MVGGTVGRGGIKWHQLTHKQLIPQGPHFCPHSTIIKAQISGRMASIGISDVVTTSGYSEKNFSEEVDDNDYEYLQKMTVFDGRQKLISIMKKGQKSDGTV